MANHTPEIWILRLAVNSDVCMCGQLLACSCLCGHKVKFMSSMPDSRLSLTVSSTQKNSVCSTTRSSGKSFSDRNRSKSTSWVTSYRRSFPLDASGLNCPLIHRGIVSSSRSPVRWTFSTDFLLTDVEYNRFYSITVSKYRPMNINKLGAVGICRVKYLLSVFRF